MRGEAVIFPAAHEVPAEGNPAVRNAVNVDDETAVLVLSLQTGQQRLVTDQGLFFPQPLEEIVEVRKLVRVEPHEVAIVRDNKGAFTFHAGNGTGDESGAAFHIPPFSELVTMMWSSGTSKEDVEANVVRNAKQVAYKVPVQKIVLRPQYAFFEYKVRTSDNVELVLEGTIFWAVKDVPRMIERTGDPKGDVWYHARSALIQAVSKVDLLEFMASFNTIARAAAADEAFYEERGVKLYSLEVTRYECADGKTASVLRSSRRRPTGSTACRSSAATTRWSTRSSPPRLSARSSAPRSSRRRRPTRSYRSQSRASRRARASPKTRSPSSDSSTSRCQTRRSGSRSSAFSRSRRP